MTWSDDPMNGVFGRWRSSGGIFYWYWKTRRCGFSYLSNSRMYSEYQNSLHSRTSDKSPLVWTGTNFTEILEREHLVKFYGHIKSQLWSDEATSQRVRAGYLLPRFSRVVNRSTCSPSGCFKENQLEIIKISCRSAWSQRALVSTV